jgi:gamma-glutamyltranspeptidase/glutathione hydrolase
MDATQAAAPSGSAVGALLLMLALVACEPEARRARRTGLSVPAQANSEQSSPPKIQQSPPPADSGARGIAQGRFGVVTAVESHAVDAGVRVLELGGNAVDAAAAVAYALAVTHPSAGNLGGGGFLLVRPAGGPTRAFDFRETAPHALTRAIFDRMIRAGGRGTAAAGVPGTVAGLELAHARFGRLSRRTVLAPAIELATSGFVLGERQAKTLTWNWARLRRDERARLAFGRGDRPLAAGATIRLPELARTLHAIAEEGRRAFYAGAVARQIVDSLGDEGLLTLYDLASYRAVERDPLAIEYGGYHVEIMPPPSSGGVAVAQMLLMLERLDAERAERGSTDALHRFIEAARRAQAERRGHVVDPDALDADALTVRFRRWTNPDALLDRYAVDDRRATPSQAVSPLFEGFARELEHTTHFAVADAEGMTVSATVTLSAGFGTSRIAGTAGFFLNNAVASFSTAGDNLPTPGRRTTSSMTPLVASRPDETVLVLGSPGGDTIPSTVVQVFRNLVDYRMPLDQAVEAPRIHHGLVPDEVRHERAKPISRDVLDALRQRGHRIADAGSSIGDANVVIVEGGIAMAYADSREGGKARAARPQ